MFRIPTDLEHVTLSENKWKIQNKWCHICLAPAPVILQFFVVVVCTVLNDSKQLRSYFKVQEPKTLLQRAKTGSLRKNIHENQEEKVSVQTSLKIFSWRGRAALANTCCTICTKNYTSVQFKEWPEC